MFAPRYRSSLKLKIKNEKLKVSIKSIKYFRLNTETFNFGLWTFNLAPNSSEERLVFFSSGYWDVSLLQVSLPHKAGNTDLQCWVPPLGNLRVKGC